jgi:hypothetical protein
LRSSPYPCSERARMEGRDMSRLGMMAVWCTMIVAFPLASCSRSDSATLTAPDCGRGTPLDNGECVASQDASSSDALADVAVADVDLDGSALADGDAASDAAPPDPCPDSTYPPTWVDCSGQCSPSLPANANCYASTAGLACPSGPTWQGTPAVPSFPATIRTPQGPSPVCEGLCSVAGPSLHEKVTNALLFAVHPPAMTYAEIRVSDPWWAQEMVNNSLGPPNSNYYPNVIRSDNNVGWRSRTGCLRINSGVVEVGTTDPDPPSRNITITIKTPSDPSDPSCAP